MSDAGAPLPTPGGPDPLQALCARDPLWLERYQGWHRLGQGASATVVRTRSLALGEDIALKLFQHLDEDGLRRFQQEVRHNQRLASPYIVRTYSPFLRVGLSWLEMEWVDGPDLRHELRRRAQAGQAYDAAETCTLGAALAEALMVAHAGGIVHRDVKPANILLPRTGRPAAKLGDFGISRVVGAARLTATGLIAGTPQFVAPEIIAGQSADARADIYSLALVLFLVASGGRFPFDIAADDPPARWLQAHSLATPGRLRSLAPDVPPWLDELIAHALAKRPEQRPTAAEMAVTLAAHAVPESTRPLTRVAASEGVSAATSPPASLVATVTSAATLARPDAVEPGRTSPANPAPLATVVPNRTVPGRSGRGLRVLVVLGLAALGTWAWIHRTLRSAPPPAPEAATPAASAKPVARLSAALEGPMLVLVHDGGPSLPPGEIVAFDVAGNGYRARWADAIEAGQQVGLALDAMEPPFPMGGRLARVELRAPVVAGTHVVLAERR